MGVTKCQESALITGIRTQLRPCRHLTIRRPQRNNNPYGA
jgi:hypothetical protein